MRRSLPATHARHPNDHLDYLWPHASVDPDGATLIGDVVEEEMQLLKARLRDEGEPSAAYSGVDRIEAIDEIVRRFGH